MNKSSKWLFGLLAVACSYDALATTFEYGADPTLPRTGGLSTSTNVGRVFLNSSQIVTYPGKVTKLEAYTENIGTSYALIYTKDLSNPGRYIVTGSYAMTFTNLGYQSFDNPAFTGSSIASLGSVFGFWSPTVANGGASIAFETPGASIWLRNGGAVTSVPGIGSSLALNAIPSSSRNYSFQITVVPEPSTVLMIGFGFAGWAATRRRRYVETA